MSSSRFRRAALSAAAAAVASLLAAASAFAGSRADCGNVELLAVGECHFEFDGGCKTQCEPLRFVAACDGQCDATLDASCTGSCQADCKAACEPDPGQFSCAASCKADCSTQVAMECGDDQECWAYCETLCASNCDAQCDVVAPQAECEAQCEACCGGSCETSAEFECTYSCSGELVGGCETQCEAPEGALFCDGQYVAVTNLPGCLEYLAENFQVSVSVEAQASAELRGCAASPGAPDRNAIAGFAALGALAIFAARRRRP
jgi:MYXO-CTERM domain-containing protein